MPDWVRAWPLPAAAGDGGGTAAATTEAPRLLPMRIAFDSRADEGQQQQQEGELGSPGSKE